MIGLMVLHWGTVDLTIKVGCPSPASGVIKSKKGTGGTASLSGSGGSKCASGSGGK